MKDNKKMMWRTLLVFLVLAFLYNVMNSKNNTNTTAGFNDPNYKQFMTDVKDGKIKDVVIKEKLKGPRELKVRYIKDDRINILLAPQDSGLIPDLLKNNINITTIPEEEPNALLMTLLSWLPTIALIGVFIWMTKKSMGGKGNPFTFGKNKAKMIPKDMNTVKFSDVAGCDEAKEEVQEVIEFLKNPEKFSKLGGKIPRGILLTGSPGTGKTMLAKAIAHEADVPFFYTTGSDFVEMFVGVGASRVRDMFAETKKYSPCILFIDEIDAVGQKRSNGSYGNDEREQTLNQLLVEMDGIEGNNGVIIVGATNRPDMLDPALLRPGRLDRQVVVNLPDVRGREQILKIHARNVPVDVNLNLTKIAKGTPGFSGADLANLVNEAAIFAARSNKMYVDNKSFEDAKDKIIMGAARHSALMPEKEKENTAYHESGHAVVAKFVPTADPVHKVTIIPRGRALGVTMQLPDEDKYSHDREDLLGMICVLMGGRIAEEIFLGHMTTGASNDIERATSIARSMVTKYGMSDKLGPLSYGDHESAGFLGGGSSNSQHISTETKIIIDQEIHRIITEQYNRAKTILETNRDKVEAMTKALLEIETIDDWQIKNIMNGLPHSNVVVVNTNINSDLKTDLNNELPTTLNQPNPVINI